MHHKDNRPGALQGSAKPRPLFPPGYSLTMRTSPSRQPSPPSISPRQRVNVRPTPTRQNHHYNASRPIQPQGGNMLCHRFDGHRTTSNINSMYDRWSHPTHPMQQGPLPSYHPQLLYRVGNQPPPYAQATRFVSYGHPQTLYPQNIHQFRPPFPPAFQPAYKAPLQNRRIPQIPPPLIHQSPNPGPHIVSLNLSDTESECSTRPSLPPRRSKQKREWPTTDGLMVFDVSDTEDECGDGFDVDSDSDQDMEVEIGRSIKAKIPIPVGSLKKWTWPDMTPVLSFDISDTEYDSEDEILELDEEMNEHIRFQESHLSNILPPPSYIYHPPSKLSSKLSTPYETNLFLDDMTSCTDMDIDLHIQRVTESKFMHPTVSIPKSSWFKRPLTHTSPIFTPSPSQSRSSSPPLPPKTLSSPCTEPKAYLSSSSLSSPPSPTPSDHSPRVQLPSLSHPLPTHPLPASSTNPTPPAIPIIKRRNAAPSVIPANKKKDSASRRPSKANSSSNAEVGVKMKADVNTKLDVKAKAEVKPKEAEKENALVGGEKRSKKKRSNWSQRKAAGKRQVPDSARAEGKA